MKIRIHIDTLVMDRHPSGGPDADVRLALQEQLAAIVEARGLPGALRGFAGGPAGPAPGLAREAPYLARSGAVGAIAGAVYQALDAPSQSTRTRGRP